MSEQFCGACCQNIRIPLTAEEYSNLYDAGSNIDVILNPPLPDEPGWDSPEGQAVIFKQLQTALRARDDEQIKLWVQVGDTAKGMNNREGLFALTGRCAFLGVTNSCLNYEARPGICQEFKAGGKACRIVFDDKIILGSPVPVEITKR